MKRIILLVVAVALVAALMAITAGPAVGQCCEAKAEGVEKKACLVGAPVPFCSFEVPGP